MVAPEGVTPASAVQRWQIQLEQGVEAGRPPLLELGFNQQLLDGWDAQAALATFHQQRTDLATIAVLVGGNSPLWPVTLLHPVDHQPASSAAGLMVLYGGSDPATYLASVTTLAADHLLAGAFVAADLPTSLQPTLAPLTNQSLPLPWSALGLALVTPHGQPTAPSDGAVPPTDPWLVWSALTLVVVLVLFALFV